MNNLTLDEEFENELCDLIAGDMNRIIVADVKKQYKKYNQLKTLFLSREYNKININNDMKKLVIEYLEPTIHLYDREDIKKIRQEIRDKEPLSLSKQDIKRFIRAVKNVKDLWLNP